MAHTFDNTERGQGYSSRLSQQQAEAADAAKITANKAAILGGTNVDTLPGLFCTSMFGRAPHT